MARRYDRAQEGIDANRLMVVRIHNGDRARMELRFAADVSIPVRGWRSRSVPQHLTKLLEMVPCQRTGPRTRHHVYGNSTGWSARPGARGCADWCSRLAGEFLDFWYAWTLLGVRLVEVVSRRSGQASFCESRGVGTHSKRTR